MRFLPRRKPKIFVNYRREDSGGHAGRLYADLVRNFGAKQIFIDIDTIEAGEDFVDVIDRSLQSCDVLIAIIGKQWLTISNEAVRRLEDPNDYVRLEIANALQRKIPVIPVLVQQASIPRMQELPPDLAPLTRRNALEISDNRWNYDVERLIKRLEQTLPEQTIMWQKLGVIFGCIIVMSIGIWLIYNMTHQNSFYVNTFTNTSPPINANVKSNKSTDSDGNLASKNLNASNNSNSTNATSTPEPSPQPKTPKTSTQPRVDYDATNDFSVTTNPKGVWSYGYVDPGASPNTSNLKLFTSQGTHYDNFSGKTFDGVYAWKIPLPAGTPIGSDIGLLVSKNLTSQKISIIAPGQLVMHPGVNGFYCVVRWTAPETGKYLLKGQFTGIGANPTTTDVHVLLQGREIFSDQINDYQRAHRFSNTLTVNNGDPVDFVVGQGSDNQIWGDSTSFNVQISRSN